MYAWRYGAQDNATVGPLCAAVCTDEYAEPGGIDVAHVAQIDNEVALAGVDSVVQDSAGIGESRKRPKLRPSEYGLWMN